MGIGAIVGWLSFFTLAWLTGLVGPSAASVGPISYAFPPLALSVVGLVLYALFSRHADFDRRRNLVLAGAALALAAGMAVLVADFEPLAVVGALISTAAASRAGGDDMVPPGAVRRPPPK
jgi:prepilin signal peptidase PulO-like enzyme (type II secretory pathway)